MCADTEKVSLEKNIPVNLALGLFNDKPALKELFKSQMEKLKLTKNTKIQKEILFFKLSKIQKTIHQSLFNA
jgi:hypothetical protein